MTRHALLLITALAIPLSGPFAGPFLGPIVAAAAHAQNAPALISVMGEGEIERAPDFATIHVSVSSAADTVAEAVEANNSATERALAHFTERGVAREDVQTVQFQVYETPERFNPDGSPISRPAFTATHQLSVVTRDVDGVGALAGEILALETMTFQSIAWGLDRTAEAQDEARRLAVADARRQAEVLSEAAGVTLGAIARISDAAMSPGLRSEMDAAPMMRMSAAASAVPIVPPAFVRYGASVRIDWEIPRRP
ncbi:MAG: SIMPL domain-containing protein [Microvirga sp.]|nr:SIMPL domain-containing protein [Microvirga sp.]